MDNTLEWISVVLALLFGVTMICQGYFISSGKYGYKHTEREKERSAKTRKQLEKAIKGK